MTTAAPAQKIYNSIYAALETIPAEELLKSPTCSKALKLQLVHELGKRIASYSDADAILKMEQPGTYLLDVAFREELASGKSILGSKALDQKQKENFIREVGNTLTQEKMLANYARMGKDSFSSTWTDDSTPQKIALSAIREFILSSLSGVVARDHYRRLDYTSWCDQMKQSPTIDWREQIAAAAFEPIQLALETHDIERLRELYMGLERNSAALTIWGRLEKVGCEAALKELGQPLTRTGASVVKK